MSRDYNLYIMIGRHASKNKPIDPNQKIIPGSDEDKLIDLSDEGKQQMYDLGKRLISPDHDHITAYHSDFLRTKRSLEKSLEGAGYDMANKSQINLVERSDIGLSGVNWNDPMLPNFEDEDQSVKIMLEQFYRPLVGRLEIPSMAKYSFSMLDTLIQGIESEIKRGSEKSLVEIMNHRPVIDGLANVLYRSLILDEDGQHRVRDYPGYFKTGEYFTGYSTDKSLNNYVFKIKDKSVSYNLDDLKKFREIHEKNSMV